MQNLPQSGHRMALKPDSSGRISGHCVALNPDTCSLCFLFLGFPVPPLNSASSGPGGQPFGKETNCNEEDS